MPPLRPMDLVLDSDAIANHHTPKRIRLNASLICVWGAKRTRRSVKVSLRGMSPDPVSFHISFKYSCTNWTAIAPSPTDDATRLTEPDRTSPAANTPGWLVSRSNGCRLGLQ